MKKRVMAVLLTMVIIIGACACVAPGGIEMYNGGKPPRPEIN